MSEAVSGEHKNVLSVEHSFYLLAHQLQTVESNCRSEPFWPGPELIACYWLVAVDLKWDLLKLLFLIESLSRGYCELSVVEKVISGVLSKSNQNLT